MLKKIILLLMVMGVCAIHGMNLSVVDQKINRRALQGFLCTSPSRIRTSMTNNWPADQLKEAAEDNKKKIIGDNQEDFALLFQIAALLPHEIQKKVMVAFFNNDEKLAEDYLKSPIGALMDLKWSQDVMNGQELYLNRFITDNPEQAGGHKLRDVQTIFSLATEIQRFESSYKNSFENASRSTLEAVNKIITVYPDVKNTGDKISYKVRKSLTIGNLVKRCKKEIIQLHVDTVACGMITMWPLAMKALSRIIELSLCTRLDTQDLIEKNKIIEAVNAWLMQSKNKAVADYHVPLNSTWDYSTTDYLKMGSPYYIGLCLPFFILDSYQDNNYHHYHSKPGPLYQMLGFTITTIGMVFSGWVLFWMERDEAIGNAAFYLLPTLALFVFKNIFFMCKQKTKKTSFSKIDELLQRTDIVIL